MGAGIMSPASSIGDVGRADGIIADEASFLAEMTETVWMAQVSSG